MLKKLSYVFMALFILLSFTVKEALAVEDPLKSANNIYGIHVIDENDLTRAAELVNSSGGDWGYVTIVIRKDERNPQRWQMVFDKMRRLHLIPIVRIATRMNDTGWEKPVEGEIDGWVSFLNSLNWVVKNRYVVIGNEPNHSKEWQGEIDPESYANYLRVFSLRLKEENNDFFVLPAGFDASAPNGPDTMDEAEFLQRMLAEEPDLFNYLDGWSSHSYPNPAFSGSPEESGRGTIRTFEWEISYLESLGVNKKLPIFITETGWVHNREGKVLGLAESSSVGLNYKKAFEVWENNNVVAVTPFVLTYRDTPFDIFSWTDESGRSYSFYDQVKGLEKVSGNPERINTGNVLSYTVQQLVKSSGSYSGFLIVENTGQVIWERDNLSIVESQVGVLEKRALFTQLEPGQKGAIIFKGNLDEEEGDFSVNVSLKYKNEVILRPEEKVLTIIKAANIGDVVNAIKREFALKVLPLFKRKI